VRERHRRYFPHAQFKKIHVSSTALPRDAGGPGCSMRSAYAVTPQVPELAVRVGPLIGLGV
jgi:hypothetical protein